VKFKKIKKLQSFNLRNEKGIFKFPVQKKFSQVFARKIQDRGKKL
jgi:hypothetical protein